MSVSSLSSKHLSNTSLFSTQFLELETKLHKWLHSNVQDEEEREGKNSFIKVVQDFLKSQTETELFFSHIQISNLPDIFDLEPLCSRVERLSITEMPISELPPSIVKLKNLTALDLDGSNLAKLPDNIGELKELSELDLSRTLIAELPLSFFELSNLKEIYLLQSQLEKIPDQIENLTRLEVFGAEGSKLNELPKGFYKLQQLKLLDLSFTEIEKLDEDLSKLERLETLKLASSHMTSLPSSICEMTSLKEIDLSDASCLEVLPFTIFYLSSETTIDIEHNVFDPEFSGFLRNHINAEGYNGPKFKNFLVDARCLLFPISEISKKCTDKRDWAFLNKLEESQKEVIFCWLNRIKDTADAHASNPSFYRAILDILAPIKENEVYLKRVLHVLDQAATTCGDRVTLSILHLSTYEKIHSLNLSHPFEVATLLHGVWKLELLESFAVKKVEDLSAIGQPYDPIEIYLAFPIYLKERLKLPLDVSSMIYFSLSNVTNKDLEDALQSVRLAIQNRKLFINYLISNDVWMQTLRIRHTERLEAIQCEKEELLNKSEEDQWVKIHDEFLLKLRELTEQTLNHEEFWKE